MAENVNEAPVSATEAKVQTKKVRRGIGSARGTTRLKFDHSFALPNGLFLGHIEEVSVSTITIGEETSGMPSFNGMEVPRLTIVFASNEEEPNKRKYASIRFLCQESNVETIPGGKAEWKVTQIFDYIKHILEVFYLKGRALTEEEEDSLSLNFQDFDENGDYVPVDSEVVIEAWTKLFNNFATMMNTGRDGKPVYLTKDNRLISCYAKLIRCIKTNKGWRNVTNGDLAFPSFVGEGVFEIYKANVKPSIRVDAVRESIIPRVSDAPKKPNMPGMPGMAGAPGMPMGGGNVGIDMNGGIADPMVVPGGLAMEAMDDTPF